MSLVQYGPGDGGGEFAIFTRHMGLFQSNALANHPFPIAQDRCSSIENQNHFQRAADASVVCHGLLCFFF